MGNRVICFIDKEGQIGICTHHYDGKHREGDCKTCRFPVEMHDYLEQFSYVRWTDLTKEEL